MNQITAKAWVAALIATFTINMSAANLGVNLDDGVVGKVTIGKAQAKSAASLPSINSYALAEKEEGVRILSLCSVQSPNLAQSRTFAMAKLGGQDMPTDRTGNPSATYFVPENGWQLFDGVQTPSYYSWLGSSVITNPATVGQHGHRVIISTCGRFPVSQYRLRVTSTATNYGSFDISVGNNPDGSEIAFNANFPGIDFGVNGVLDSHLDLVTHTWVQGGDDKVLVAGLPSTNTYTVWYRLGTTLATSGVDPLKGEFTNAVPTLTAELYTVGGGDDETIVATKTVTAAQAYVEIYRNGNSQVRLRVGGGQTLLHYQILTKASIEPAVPWSLLFGGTPYNPGQEFDQPTTEDTQRFFRFLAVP